MQKLHVIDEREGSEVPFLRGILTRSLQQFGISFDDAYVAATEIRDEIWDQESITTKDLRKVVYQYLKQRGMEGPAEAYLQGASGKQAIHVIDSDRSISPFSKGSLAQSMEICGLDQETTYQITRGIELGLINSKILEISTAELERKTSAAIVRTAGEDSGQRYREWLQFARLGKPLVLLVGGTTGTGKSTISSELAHRLDIVRTQSTDMLREVMRLMIPSRLLPTLHSSSFEAYKMFPRRREREEGTVPYAPSMITGYLTQAEQVGVGIEGVLNRAQNEHVSLILEGVHVHPALQTQIISRSNSLVVPLILGVLKKKRLRNRLIGRGQQVSSRRSERYLESFEHIWELQSFLLHEADRCNIPIIDNADEDKAIREIMQIISEHVAKEMIKAPEESA